MHKRLALLTIFLWIPACASSPAANGEQQESSIVNVALAADLPQDASGAKLVARVNGEGITQVEFEQAMNRAEQQFAAADVDALAATVLDTLIEQALIEQAAQSENIVITDALLETEYQANRILVESDAAWQQWLAENLYTEAEFRDSLRAALIASMMRDQVAATIPETVPHVHARHILVETEAAALEALNRLRAGEDFAALAASLSRDVTTREQGGDLGWFADGELLEPVLTQVAFALGDGEIGGPVATRLGYHIIQKLGSEPRELSLERRAMLTQVHFENWLRGLTFNAVIERYLP